MYPKTPRGRLLRPQVATGAATLLPAYREEGPSMERSPCRCLAKYCQRSWQGALQQLLGLLPVGKTGSRCRILHTAVLESPSKTRSEAVVRRQAGLRK